MPVQQYNLQYHRYAFSSHFLFLRPKPLRSTRFSNINICSPFRWGIKFHTRTERSTNLYKSHTSSLGNIRNCLFSVSVTKVEQFSRAPVLLGAVSGVAGDVPRCLYWACDSDVCVLRPAQVSLNWSAHIIRVSDRYIKVQWLEIACTLLSGDTHVLPFYVCVSGRVDSSVSCSPPPPRSPCSLGICRSLVSVFIQYRNEGRRQKHPRFVQSVHT